MIDIDENEILKEISKEIPYLPIEDLTNILYKNRNLNGSCAWYPTLLDVKIHNDYWQEFVNHNISYYIYGAYLDKRPTVVEDEPVVRVLSMINFIAESYEEYPVTYCQLWYDDQPEPYVSPMKEMHKIWNYEWGHDFQYNFAHFIACPLPEAYKHKVPSTVSLVAQPCDKATNNIKVIYYPARQRNETKHGFAVCVKGLDYPYQDMSNRLVEYMETMRSLGASKILMYQLQVHPNMTKVLKYYEQTGFLEYLPMSLSTKVSNLPNYRHLEMSLNTYSYMLHEVIPYSDCLYRNMYRYQYVAVVDTDEVLMPLANFSNWHELMQYAETITTENDCKKFASYCFRCAYFPHYPEKPLFSSVIPEYFYMLQHVWRVREHIRPEWNTKCLHNTDRVIATHNHFSIERIWNVCRNYSFDSNTAQLQHYREPYIEEKLNDSVVDLSLWIHKDAIIQRSMQVFQELGYLV